MNNETAVAMNQFFSWLETQDPRSMDEAYELKCELRRLEASTAKRMAKLKAFDKALEDNAAVVQVALNRLLEGLTPQSCQRLSTERAIQRIALPKSLIRRIPMLGHDLLCIGREDEVTTVIRACELLPVLRPHVKSTFLSSDELPGAVFELDPIDNQGDRVVVSYSTFRKQCFNHSSKEVNDNLLELMSSLRKTTEQRGLDMMMENLIHRLDGLRADMPMGDFTWPNNPTTIQLEVPLIGISVVKIDGWMASFKGHIELMLPNHRIYVFSKFESTMSAVIWVCLVPKSFPNSENLWMAMRNEPVVSVGNELTIDERGNLSRVVVPS